MQTLTVTAPLQEFVAINQVLDQVPMSAEAKLIVGSFQVRVSRAAQAASEAQDAATDDGMPDVPTPAETSQAARNKVHAPLDPAVDPFDRSGF